MPSELTFILVLVLIATASVCSGLNVALMSLNASELKRKARLGDRRAKLVFPLRDNAHLSLASILLVNTAAALSTSLVLDRQFNGLIAIIASTLLLVIFSELAPQAFFTKHALTVCAFLTPLLRLMIIATFPISKPLQLILDKVFGSQSTDRLHTRHELGLMIAEHSGTADSELDDDEVEIIQGALQLSEKHVSEIMTGIDHVYWLSPDTVIDSRKIDEIKAASWSRIPIFNPKRTKCYGILRMKDLVDIDFDERSYRVDELKLHPTDEVGSKTALDTMFRNFINARTHLMPVIKDRKIVGIVTIEDLIEEIIGHEIIDESDHAASRV
jgi:metal transporter CNNM